MPTYVHIYAHIRIVMDEERLREGSKRGRVRIQQTHEEGEDLLGGEPIVTLESIPQSEVGVETWITVMVDVCMLLIVAL